MRSQFKYLIFNKPFGVLSNFVDPEGRDTLKTYIDVPGVYAAGRLDYDSEGLMLLTDDGRLIREITSPDRHIVKTYFVMVEGVPELAELMQLGRGVLIQGQMTRRCKVMQIPDPDLPARSKPVTPHGHTSWLRIELREGKKRQIRHMTAAVGLPTLRIVRVAIGPITLAGLEPGQWRFLTPEEVASILKKSR